MDIKFRSECMVKLSPFYVYKLQSKIVILLHEQPHDFLEVVDLIARDPNMIVQNSWLDLDLKTLDQFDDFQTGLLGIPSFILMSTFVMPKEVGAIPLRSRNLGSTLTEGIDF